jgi:hypothetical protein
MASILIGDIMGEYPANPPVNQQVAMENDPFIDDKHVDSPIKHGDFPQV